MFNEKRTTGLKLVVFLAMVNAIITLTHFILLDKGILGFNGLINDLWIYATAVSLVAVLPAAIGAYGLYQKRMWGLGFFTLGSGAYISSSLLILLLSVKSVNFGIMFYVSIYIVIYSLLATFYSWMFRHHFREF